MTSGAKLEGKAALVLGGSRGIGAAVVQRLAAEGARVGIGCRAARGAAEEAAAAIRTRGGQAVTCLGDIARPDEAERVVAEAHQALGGLDILVNAAGVAPYRPLEAIDAAHFHELFDANVLGAALVTKAAAPLLPSPGGRIIHFASRLAISPIPTSALYAASKAAVMALTHALAKELGPRGITVNAVAPGVIETDMTAAILAERGDQIRAMTPLGRIGQPDDIAGIVAFLASEDARWITGRTILADGGAT